MSDALFAVISAASGLAGAGVGAWATLRASRGVYDRATRREEEAWRQALHLECVLNIRLGQESPADGVWTFDTRILSDAFRHAGAFTADELERISRARAEDRRLVGYIDRNERAFVEGQRKATASEINDLEALLRTTKPLVASRF
jgi:hypothetical protein